MGARCFATIISPNYLAYARVLHESIQAHAPDAAFEVLLVGKDDPSAREAATASGLSFMFATQLGLPDFELLAYKFDIVELNTALKPTFLKSLLARGFDEVIYLDPDIRLFDAPQPVVEALASAEVVLTPHALAPVMDGLRPSDIDFLRTGAFNLGFIAVRRGRNSSLLLDWWERRCLSHGFNDPSFGTFVDQKWLDLAPSYFDEVHILKHPGCNVAYWNLHERQLTEEGGKLRVNGQPLVFFHFSGVQARSPELLSRHQNRHIPVAGSPLARIVVEYCQSLLAAEHERYSKLPYGFDKLSDGRVVSAVMRRAACVRGVDNRHPFDAGSPLQRALREKGLVATGPSEASGTLTINVDTGDRRLRALNAALRLLARLVGAQRLADAVRYATFLGWQSNYPAVLLGREFELRHIDDRKELPR